MTSSTPEHAPDALDAYLDGLLEGEELSAFENRLEQDPKLREQVDRQRHIDKSLKRIYAESAGGDIVTGVSAGGSGSSVMNRVTEAVDAMAARASDSAASLAGSSPGSWRLFSRRGLSIAAILVLGALSIWNIVDQLPGLFSSSEQKIDRYAAKPWRNMATVYAEAVETGFAPDWVCETDRIFADTFQDQLGQKLLLGPTPAGVAAVGLSYTNTITDLTICLLARVDEQPVIVFIDRAERDGDHRGADQLLPEGSGLKLFSRQIGTLVLHELTPLAEPKVLASFLEPGTGGK